MSSEVMTHENWARLHVARRVSDIAKSMIKLSRLGRSIFPTPSHPLRGGEELAARLKVSEASCVRTRTAKAYPRNLGCARPMNPRATVIDAQRASPEQVSAFRLSRHHLVKRASASALAQVAGDMAGVQAQVLSAAQISLWARTRGLSADDVENALWRDRTLVKSWCIRGALHIIPSKDFAVFVRGGDRRNARSTAWLVRARMPIEGVDRLVEAMRDGLDRPLTRSEIAERITASLGIKSVEKSHRGWGGTSTATGFRIAGKMLSLDGIVFLACLRGLACFGPARGAQATFVRPEKWLPDWNDLPVEKAELELLRRYLRADGPATVSDFALWTYMTAPDSREIWARLEPEMAPVDVDGRIGWVLREDLPALRRSKLDEPVIRLLPAFGAVLLRGDGQHTPVELAHYKRGYPPPGGLPPVPLRGGRGVGGWSPQREGVRPSVRITPLDP